MSNTFNVKDDLKELELDEIQKISKDNALPYAVAALNVDGDLNLGTMIRNAVIFGAEQFFIFGRRKYDKRSTVGAHNYIDITKIDLDIDKLDEEQIHVFRSTLWNAHYTPIFVETGGDNFSSMDFSSQYTYLKPCFVFGSEHGGIPFDLTELSTCITIPQHGVLRSLNVSSASSIILHKAYMDFTKEKDNV